MRAPILDPKFKYTPAAATDIQETWRKFGWKPVKEQVEMPKKQELPPVARGAQ